MARAASTGSDADILLEIENLKVGYKTSTGTVTAIPDLTLKIRRGEAYGIVGESGCGKTTLLSALMRHLGSAGRILGGRLMFDGTDIVTASDRQIRDIRANGISMVYQDPNAALNPVLTVGQQLMEVPMIRGASANEARSAALKVLADVHLPDPDNVMTRYPHQMSGGQKQRVVIAMALLAQPKLMLLDEPTTGLDVTVEAAVLDLINELRAKYGTTLVYITHNLGVVAKICDRVGVMYLGELVEEASVFDLFKRPMHPYSRRLMACVPQLGGDKHTTAFQPIRGQPPTLAARPAGCTFAPRCPGATPGLCDKPLTESAVGAGHRVLCARAQDVDSFQSRDGTAGDIVAPGEEAVIVAKDLSKIYDLSGGGFSFAGGPRRQLIANSELEFDAKRAEILAIVGESGSGKSTFARVLAGLHSASGGKLVVMGEDIAEKGIDQRTPEQIAMVQMVFQNPDATLNPSHSAAYPIARVLKNFGITRNAEETEKRVDRLFELVRLPLALKRARPTRLSGGQKQRIAIARAFAAEPGILVADEPVSALDVSVQAAIVNLLLDIQRNKGTTIVFISHDLALVRHLADRALVMYLGKIMEIGPVDRIFEPPYHPYTEALLSAVPIADPTIVHERIKLEGEPPSPVNVPTGCRFSPRCPRKLGDICSREEPPAREVTPGHVIHCHIPIAELAKVKPVFQQRKEVEAVS
jgi:peptide/nickel transport system ATP-binding protein